MTHRTRAGGAGPSIRRSLRLVSATGLMGSLMLASVLCVSGPARADDDEGGSMFDKAGAAIGNSFGGVKKMFGGGGPPPPPPVSSPSGCPEIVILDGTAAQRVMANPTAGNEGLKYQFSLNDVARECSIANNQMTVKVGVEGRVLLGPAGAPGAFNVPIRVVIVNELDQKPFASKLYKVAASIASGQTGTPFTLVSETIVVPFAAGRTAEDYSIKVGIDNGKVADGATKPTKPRRRAKSTEGAAPQ